MRTDRAVRADTLRARELAVEIAEHRRKLRRIDRNVARREKMGFDASEAKRDLRDYQRRLLWLQEQAAALQRCQAEARASRQWSARVSQSDARAIDIWERRCRAVGRAINEGRPAAVIERHRSAVAAIEAEWPDVIARYRARLERRASVVQAVEDLLRADGHRVRAIEREYLARCRALLAASLMGAAPEALQPLSEAVLEVRDDFPEVVKALMDRLGVPTTEKESAA